MIDDEQVTIAPPGMPCPACGSLYDCETARSLIQVNQPVQCLSCGFDLTDLIQSFYSTASNE